MLRGLVILGLAVSVVGAGGMRAPFGSLAGEGGESVAHAHTHYHDGHVHTHWHHHSDSDRQPPSDNGDHHDELGGPESEDLPLCRPPARVVRGRQDPGPLLPVCGTVGIVDHFDPPPSPPPKPPPRSAADPTLLHEHLRTVILLS